MFDWLSAAELASLLSVIAIDIALAGDNAIVVGMAAAGLPILQRRRAIILGIVAAAVMRIAFAFFATQLLDIIGLLLAGGILLLWVSWKLWRELRQGHHEEPRAVEALDDAIGSDGTVSAKPTAKTFKQAVIQIVIADLSMSLDNVLAVAGAAREHPWVLIFGLALSVALMGIAANFIARLLQRHHWIAYIGLLVIVYVSIKMIWEGWLEVAPLL